MLTERLVAELSVNDKDQRFALLRTQAIGSKFNITTLGKATYALPEISNSDVCTDNLDSNEPYQRARWPTWSYGSLDRQ